MRKGKLFLVPTPIGNKEDITLRAIRILREADFVICEEFKKGGRLLREYEIKNELLSVNEHNERENTNEIIQRMLSGENGALVSDAGSPLFSDPGHFLVSECLAYGIEVIPLPGANSLIPALMASGIDTEKFYYYGWLSPKKEIRRKELLNLKREKKLIALMETPYRLQRLLDDCIKILGANMNAVLAYKISMPEEKFFRATLIAIKKMIKDLPKGEFVLLIDNRN